MNALRFPAPVEADSFLDNLCVALARSVLNARRPLSLNVTCAAQSILRRYLVEAM